MWMVQGLFWHDCVEEVFGTEYSIHICKCWGFVWLSVKQISWTELGNLTKYELSSSVSVSTPNQPKLMQLSCTHLRCDILFDCDDLCICLTWHLVVCPPSVVFLGPFAHSTLSVVLFLLALPCLSHYDLFHVVWPVSSPSVFTFSLVIPPLCSSVLSYVIALLLLFPFYIWCC